VSPSLDSPYVGLTHFTEDYADRFFGRDTECALIIGNLRAARLTLLYAESGVGKSSVLRAGVVARLHGFADNDLRTRGSPRLVPVVFSSWSERPVAALIRAIGDATRPYLSGDAVLELPEDDLEGAIERASAALGATLLIVLDQFEEYFLYPDDQEERKRVAAQLARCVNRSDLRANFLISIREDAYAQLGDLFRGKVTNVYGNFLHLDFLDRAGATESIEKPIERANELGLDADPVELEPALVTAVLDQVGRGRIAAAGDGRNGDADRRDEVETTYLQLVMRRLWEQETSSGSHRLRLRTLEDLGGAQAIIRGHLDRAMEGTEEGDAGLSDDQRRVAAAVFHFLVTSGGTKIALTAKDLADLSGLSRSEIEPVLQHLSSPGLHILRPVVSEDGQREPRFEIFHDALARPIVDWRTRVEEAELDARVAGERAKKEAAQRAAVEAERRAAGERKRKRLALGLLGLAVIALLAGAAYFGIDQSNRADRRDADADSVRAARRVDELVGAPTFGFPAAALASVEAYGLSPTSEARNQALGELQLDPAMPKIVGGHTRRVNTVAFWPGSGKFASGGSDGTVRLWSARGDELRKPLVNPSREVQSIAVSKPLHGGRRLVVAGMWPGVVRLWEVEDTGKVRFGKYLLKAGTDDIRGLAFNPRVPSMLAVGDSDGRVMLWDLGSPQHPHRLGTERAGGQVNDLAFAADGRYLLVASGDGGQAWKVSDSGFASSGPAMLVPARVESAATAANGSYAFGTRKGITLWDGGRGRGLRFAVLGGVPSLAFARGGSVLVSGGEDWNVTTWNVASGRPFGPPRATIAQGVTDVAISPDGGTIASASEDNLVKLWPLQPTHALAATVGGLSPGELDSALPDIERLAVGAGSLVAAAAGPAGTTIWKLPGNYGSDGVARPLARSSEDSYAVAYRGSILAAGRRHSFVLEDTGPDCPSMPAEPCRLGTPERAHSEEVVFSLAFAKYGGRLLLASSGYLQGEGVLNLWDVTDAAKSGRVVHLSTRRLEGTRILAVAFSSTSPLVAVGAADGKTRVWDVSDPSVPEGVRIRDPRGNEAQPVAAVAFSPDGTLLASGGQDQQVVLWRVTQHGSDPPTVDSTPGTLFQSQTIFSLAFSPDGKILAAGNGDGKTCLYEVESREEIGGGACLLGHAPAQGGIKAVGFAPFAGGEAALLTAGTGQPIVAWNPILWNLSRDDRVDRAIAANVCALAGRNLTSYEWNAIFDGTKLADDRHRTCPRFPLPE
jgi:WD40 repeat protein